MRTFVITEQALRRIMVSSATSAVANDFVPTEEQALNDDVIALLLSIGAVVEVSVKPEVTLGEQMVNSKVPKSWASQFIPGHNVHIPGTTHYLRSRTFQSWFNMIARCYYKGAHTEKDYYYAGIRVCPRWLSSFDNFLDDLGHRPKGMTLDRKNPRKGYSPLNCRWATAKQQARNKRKAA